MNEPKSGPLIAVLDYGIGNLRSAQKGFQRAGADVRLTDDRGLICLLYTTPSPRDGLLSRMPSSA